MQKTIIMGIISLGAIFSISSTSINAQLVNDPYLDGLFASSDALVTRSLPENQQFKDQQWDPPQTPQDSWDICVRQAQNMGVYDPMRHCSGIAFDCANYKFSFIECYGQHMVISGQAPKDIQQVIDQKFKDGIEANDIRYRGTMCPARDGTMGDYC